MRMIKTSCKKCENWFVNMCFMLYIDYKDEINSSTINDELENIFEKLYLDL